MLNLLFSLFTRFGNGVQTPGARARDCLTETRARPQRPATRRQRHHQDDAEDRNPTPIHRQRGDNRIGGQPGNGAPGDPLGVFHVVAYAPQGDELQAVFGDTYVAAVEFTPTGPRAQAILTYGNASRPGDPHNGDQLRLLAEKRLRPSWRTRAEIEANLESRTPIERPAP